MTQQYVPNLGSLCDDSARRDCVHVAVAPVVAGERLLPGWRVRLEDNKAYLARETIKTDTGDVEPVDEVVGIVDPFLPLPKYIRKGQRFWLFLLPGSVTSIRHLWTHPAFPARVPTTQKGEVE